MHLLFKNILLKEIKKFSNKKILVAFSGGKDSLSLLNFLSEISKDLNIDVVAVYVNHGLRETAIRDEIFCKEFCRKLNIPIYIENISEDISKDNSNSTEAIARKYRYERLYILREKLNCDYIFTAHTYSDNIENFFVDLYTGASIFSISGIMYHKDYIIRPMLNITTDMVNAYLDFNNIEPTFDETNNDTKYIRNMVRHNIIPVLKENGSQFEKTILNLQLESNKIKEYFYNKTIKAVVSNDFFNSDIKNKKENVIPSIIIDKEIFDTFEYIEKEFLLGLLFSPLFRMSKMLINDIIYNLKPSINTSKMSKRLDLPNNYVIDLSYNLIRIYSRKYISNINLIKEIGEDTVSFDGFIIKFKNNQDIDFINKKLIIRRRLNGDNLIYKNGKKKKLKDVFIDKHVELALRDSAIVIEDFNDHKILFVEHVFTSNAVEIIYP